MTLEELLKMFEERVQNRFFGKYEGKVTNVDDPLKIGRLKAKVPAVFGEDTETGWALPCAPFGADQSLFAADRRAALRLQREAAEEQEDRREGDRRRNDESEADAYARDAAGHHHGADDERDRSADAEDAARHFQFEDEQPDAECSSAAHGSPRAGFAPIGTTTVATGAGR